MENQLINITNNNGVLTVSSREIAEHFKKEHRNVVQAIQNLTAENSAVKNMFIESTYKNNRGKEYKEYQLTRDGFSLLVMGFTGKKALAWKLKYIEAFNKMEKALRGAVPALKGVESSPQAKIYNEQKVVTLRDCEQVWGIDHAILCGYLKEKQFIPNNDYYILAGMELEKFKEDNPDVSKFTSSITIITQKGLKKLTSRVQGDSSLKPYTVNDMIDKMRVDIKMLNALLEIVESMELKDDYFALGVSIARVCCDISVIGSDLKREIAPCLCEGIAS